MDVGGSSFETEHVFCDILKRLPVKSLLRFMCVSKPWTNLITDPFFVSSHLEFNNQSSSSSGPDFHAVLGTTINRDYYGKNHEEHFEYFRIDNTLKTTVEHLNIPFPWKRKFNRKDPPPQERCKTLGHCNGVVFVRYSQTFSVPIPTTTYSRRIKWDIIQLDNYIICNPIARRFKILPDSDIDLPELPLDNDYVWGSKQFLQAFGFGFIDYLVYKVVRVTYGIGRRYIDDIRYYKSYEQSIVEVYDSRSDYWKRVSVDTNFSYQHLQADGVYNSSDGCVYWLGRGYGNRSRYSTLVSFDLVKEKMHEILLPYKENDYGMNNGDHDGNVDDDVFGEYGFLRGVHMQGRSVVMIVGDQRNELVLSVWKMDNNKICWTFMYRLNFGGSAQGFCRDGELLLSYRRGGSKNWNKLYMFDSNKMNDDCFGFKDLGIRVSNVVPNFVESLILLDGEIEVIEDVPESEEIVDIPATPRKRVWEEEEDLGDLVSLFDDNL